MTSAKKQNRKRIGLLASLVASALLLLGVAAPAAASASVKWEIESDAQSTVSPAQSGSADTTQSSTLLTEVSGLSGVQVGWGISGVAIPHGAVVTSVISPTEIEISKEATATLAGVALAAGPTFSYFIHIGNVGDTETDGSQVTVTAQLPPGLTFVHAGPTIPFGFPLRGFSCSASASLATCTTTSVFPRGWIFSNFPLLKLTVAVDDSTPGDLLSARFSVAGGEPSAVASTIHDPTRVSAEPTRFGIDGFDAQALDSSGAPFQQAGRAPDSLLTSIGIARTGDSSYGQVWPVQAAKDISVDSPPGLLGGTAGRPRCSVGQLLNMEGNLERSLCPVGSQLGTITVPGWFGFTGFEDSDGAFQAYPLFNMVPPPGVAARFGANLLGVLVTLDATVRGGGDYGITVSSHNIDEGVSVLGSQVTLWGDPSDPGHDWLRACPNSQYPTKGGPTAPAGCPANYTRPEPTRFLRNPTACTEPGEGLTWTANADSWQGSTDSKSIVSHKLPGFPSDSSEFGEPQGPEGCASVPFEPEATVKPTNPKANAPTGLEVDLRIPQTCWEPNEEIATCQSDLKRAEVTLPEGMSLNPSSASGLEACTSNQIGLLGTEFPMPAPTHFTDEAPNCPESSKIGEAEVTTPLLDHKIKLGVYQAAQGDNPFHSLAAIYIAGRDEESGVTLKLAGQVKLDPNTGRLTTVFEDQPQQPFSQFHLVFKSGQRAPLINPPCGKQAVGVHMSGWSGATANPPASFEITEGCGDGFNPKLSAGTENPLAGTTSPFVLRLTREDGEAALSGLSVTLPPGLSGYLKGIPYCPDSVLAGISGDEGTGAAQIASPSCPAASQVGTVTVGSGAGTNPFFTDKGRAYLAGPYKGAPLSLAVVTPAVAGPFDLGSVVVRNALRIDPETAQITNVSDPLPTILHGIPLDLRDVRVDLTRNHFTLNPTSCDPMSVTSTITGTGGASASPSDRFQVGNCSRLGFKPKLSLRLKGKTNRGAHPALKAVLTMPEGEANIARAAVTLPSTELLENAHIRNVCTRVIYAEGEGGGANCPKSSIYGYAKAWSPLLDQPLQGPVFLRSNPENKSGLPDLVASLDGQIHVDLVGKIDTVNARIRNTFKLVPDAPVSKFMLTMQGNGKGLLANTGGVCDGPLHAIALFDAQNGKTHDIEPVVRVDCGGKGRKGGGKGAHHRR